MQVEVHFHAVEFTQSPLREAPEVLDSVDVDAVPERELALAVVDPEMPVEPNVDEAVVPFPSVRIQDGILQTDLSLDDRAERRRLAIRNDFGVDFHVASVVFSLYQAENRLFQGSSPAFQFPGETAFPFRPEIAFVHFDFTADFFLESRDPTEVDDLPEDSEVPVGGLPVVSQKFAGFRRVYVHAKALDNFFQLVDRDFSVRDHEKRV